MGVALKYVGKAGWRGQDYDGTELHVAPGGVVEMSAERAAKVLADYPKAFERVGVEVVVEQHESDTSAEPSDVHVRAVMPGDVAVGSLRRRRRG